VTRTLVGQVVAVDGGQHDVVEADFGDCAGDLGRFVGIKGFAATGLDVAEATRAGAFVAHQHERRRSGAVVSAPALAHIRAVGLFTHRMQVSVPQRLFDPGELLAGGERTEEPIGLPRATHTHG